MSILRKFPHESDCTCHVCNPPRYEDPPWHGPCPKLLCINISGIVVLPEPMGDGYQVHEEGNKANWSRGDSVYEAIGSLIYRLAVEADGANERRTQNESA